MLLRIVHREYGWRSFSYLARLDISLELYHTLCTLHASLFWCLLTAVVHVIALCAGGSGGSGAGSGSGLTPIAAAGLPTLLLGCLWALFLLSWAPTGVASRAIRLDSRLRRCSRAAGVAGRALMLCCLVAFPLAEPVYLLAGLIARARTLRAQLGDAQGALHVMLLVEEASFTAGAWLAYGSALFALSRLRRERKALVVLHQSLSMLRQASRASGGDKSIEGHDTLHASVGSKVRKRRIPTRGPHLSLSCHFQ